MKRPSSDAISQAEREPKRTRSQSSCIRKIDHYISKSQKFQFTRSESKFIIEDIEQCPDPAEELKKCIQQSKDDAVEDGIKTLGGADQVGLILSSVLLDQGDITVPFIPINANIIDAFYNHFQKVEQSKAKTVNLYGEPFVVTVIVRNSAALPKRRTTKGKGQRSKNKQPYLLYVNNNDTLCLFYALELMRYYSLYKRGIITRKTWRWINEKQTTVLRTKVLILLRETGIPTNESIYDAEIYIHIVQGYWNLKYPGEYKIYIFNNFHTTAISKSEVSDYQFPILLFHHDDHFDGIKTINKFMDHRNYCLSCEKGYTHKFEHTSSCTSLCFGCREIGIDFPCEFQEGYTKKCYNCDNIFYNKKCYERHLQKDICRKFKRCDDCGVIYSVKVNTRDGREGHKCGEKFCRLCKQFHIIDDNENPCANCFIQPLVQRPIKPYRIITYDFECTQDKQGLSAKQQFEHEVNFAAATIICTECIAENTWKESLKGKKCEICGPYRTITFSPFKYKNTIVDRKVITKRKANEPLRKFVEWILFEHNSKYSTVAFAHFGGRYDMTMVIKEVIKQGIYTPDIIKQGNKLYEIKIKAHDRGPETLFRDSYNLMPIKLSGLIKSFGLQIQDKQHFPHMFNKSSNYNNILPHLPPREDYCPNQKKRNDLDKFEEWYSNPSNYHQQFDLKEKLPEYCCNDVQILTYALIELRKEYRALTRRQRHNGIDILWQSITIASACVKNFALNHLEAGTLAIVPEKGYTPVQNQSAIALKYLDWYSKINNVSIQTAQSRYGEFVFKREGKSHMVDGYIKGVNGKRDKIIEVNGCLWHCCEECFDGIDEEVKMPNGKTVKEIRENDKRKCALLKRYMDLEVIWEHEINAQLRKNEEMKNFFDSWIDCSPIKIRDAFHGGRTGCQKLIHTLKPGQKMGYKDFTSLYPFTNYTTKYPLGHPKIISFPRNEQMVNWQKSSDNPFKGVLKVLLIPPNYNLNVTVMPVRFDVRLLFPACKKCAQHYTKSYPNGIKDDNYSCPHYNPTERGFVSTCTDLELNIALDAGYTVRKLFHVLQYDQWSDNIFKSYVSEMMALKIHATGFPSWCQTEEEKDKYIQECWEKFSIKIEKSKMKVDPGKRYIAKLCLNSLWGRFSLRNLLSKAIINNDASVIRQYDEDKKIEVMDLEMIDEDNDVYMLTYKPKEEFVDENKYSNVVLSLFTTSAARLYLYDVMKKVADTPGCEILYYDTDSIIYVHPESFDPLPTGKGHLGELTDEKPQHDIVEFISAGCKNYGLKLRKKDTGEIEYELKIRGFTLDEQTCHKLHYEAVKEQILNYGTDNPSPPISVTYPNFLRPNLVKGKVYSQKMTKMYQPTITKGIVNDAYQVLEFGFRK